MNPKRPAPKVVRKNAPTGGAIDDPAPTEPVLPDLEACCGSGCNPCIFDVYEAARERYLADLAAWQQRQAQRRLRQP